GAERESTTLVTDSLSESKIDIHVLPHDGEAVEPFIEGSDPLAEKKEDSDSSVAVSDETDPVESSAPDVSTDSKTTEEESFLEQLFHREPTTLDDSELEILRQARLVYLVFRDDKHLSREKARKIRDLLQEVGCKVVVRFCREKAERAGEIFAEAAKEGAGTIILEYPKLELAEENLTPILDAGVRFISISDLHLSGFTPNAVMLPDETAAIRTLAEKAAAIFPNGSYLCTADTGWNTDLADQFDETLDVLGRPFARVAKYPELVPKEEGNVYGLSSMIKMYDDLRFVLCPNTSSAREAARVLKKLKRTDIGVLCLYGEGNILELIEKGYVQAAGVYDTDILASSVMNAFDSLAEKGNAGDYALCYINTVVRTSTEDSVQSET
ncbi:MAG: hypothetical protein ACSW75_06600, partial [Lachnospiraceae bacterium]